MNNPQATAFDFPHKLLAEASECYAPDVCWTAPRRSLAWHGRDEVVRRLLAEAAGMRAPRYTPLRRAVGERQAIDEYVVRFTYAGAGIENVPIAAGDEVELGRLRILALEGGCVCTEICIETWTVLGGGPSQRRG